MGASAVLLFAVPASPMAQPWPIIGGNTISALVGFAVGQAIGHGALACGLGLGPAIAAAHDALLLIADGLLFHRLSGHPYPHPGAAAPTEGPAPARGFEVSDEGLDAVLAKLGETYDIDREDLRLLLGELELRVLAGGRTRPGGWDDGTMRDAVICEPLRTPVGRFGGALKDVLAVDLAAIVLRGLVGAPASTPARSTTSSSASATRTARRRRSAGRRRSTRRSRVEVPGLQLDRRCGSGLYAAMQVQTGAGDVVIAGGAESVSPIGATGGRILAALLREMDRRGAAGAFLLPKAPKLPIFIGCPSV